MKVDVVFILLQLMKTERFLVFTFNLKSKRNSIYIKLSEDVSPPLFYYIR